MCLLKDISWFVMYFEKLRNYCYVWERLTPESCISVSAVCDEEEESVL